MLKDFFTTLGTGALDKVLHAVLVLVIGILIIRIVTKLLRGGLFRSQSCFRGDWKNPTWKRPPTA